MQDYLAIRKATNVPEGFTSEVSLVAAESRAETRSLCDCVGQQTALADELFVLAEDEGLGAAE